MAIRPTSSREDYRIMHDGWYTRVLEFVSFLTFLLWINRMLILMFPWLTSCLLGAELNWNVYTSFVSKSLFCVKMKFFLLVANKWAQQQVRLLNQSGGLIQHRSRRLTQWSHHSVLILHVEADVCDNNTEVFNGIIRLGTKVIICCKCVWTLSKWIPFVPWTVNVEDSLQ